MSRKPIIVFEGIEGSGKSHHISIVSKYLNRKKIDHIKIREPGGNPNSEKIRRLLLNNKSNFKYLYSNEIPLLQKIEKIAKEIYRANSIEVEEEIKKKNKIN